MKEFLKDMDFERAFEIVKKNKQLENELYERCYEVAMWQQSEEFELVLGKEWRDYVDYNDSYSSFYLRLNDSVKLIKNIDGDYLDEYDKRLLVKGVELVNKWDDMTWEEQDEDEETEEQIDKIACELLEHIESMLHEYENISDEFFRDEVANWLEDCEHYIKDGEDSVVYLDVTKSYK